MKNIALAFLALALLASCDLLGTTGQGASPYPKTIADYSEIPAGTWNSPIAATTYNDASGQAQAVAQTYVLIVDGSSNALSPTKYDLSNVVNANVTFHTSNAAAEWTSLQSTLDSDTSVLTGHSGETLTYSSASPYTATTTATPEPVSYYNGAGGVTIRLTSATTLTMQFSSGSFAFTKQ